jgi:hypothetical protein
VKPAQDALAAILAQHPTAEPLTWTERTLTARLPDGRYVTLATADPLYTPVTTPATSEDPARTNLVEIDTAWKPTSGAWQYQMTTAPYEAYARNVLNAGNAVEYRARSGESVTFQPLSLNWRDVNNSQEYIAGPGSVTTVVEDDRLAWPNGYGPGRHLSWTARPTRLQKLLTIDSAAALPTPAPWLGADIHLELTFAFTYSASVTAYIDGVAWNKTSTLTTANRIEFKNAQNETLWAFEQPRAWDSGEAETTGSMRVYQSGALHISVRIPRAFVDAAVYPLFIDPTVQPFVAAAADDVRWSDSTFNANSTYIVAESDLETQGSAVRWPLSVPRGATIDSAVLRLQGTDSLGTIATTIKAHAADNSTVITTRADAVGRTRTSASVSWTPPTFAYETMYDSPDIKTVIQEVTDRTGWASGNYLTLFWEHASGSGSREASAFDRAAVSPQLLVTYTNPTDIAFISSAAGITTATMPLHEAGDLIVALAFSDGQNPITLPTGNRWRAAKWRTGSSMTVLLVYKIAASSSETVGTFTNATNFGVVVYRGTDQIAPLGDISEFENASTTANVNFLGLTLQNATGSSWVGGFVGHRNADTNLENPPSGWSNRLNDVNATALSELACHDSNGGLTSWAGANYNVGGTAGAKYAVSFEIRAPHSQGASNSITFIASAVGTTASPPAIPAHVAGDLIVGFGFNDASTTQVSFTASNGWRRLFGFSANTSTLLVAYNFAVDSATLPDTWSNATAHIYVVYRGVNPSAPFGMLSHATGASTTVTYPINDLALPSGYSWVAGLAAHRSANTTLETPPGTMALRGHFVDAANEAVWHDTNGAVSVWNSTDVSVGGTSSGWHGLTLELLPKYDTSGIPIAGDLDGSGDLTATLVRAQLLAGALDGSGDIAGALTRAALLASALDGSGDLTAAQTRAAPLASALDGSGDLTAAQTYVGLLTAAHDGSGDLTAAIIRAQALASALDGSGDIAGALTRAALLAGDLDGSGDVEGALTVLRALTLTPDGTISSSGIHNEAGTSTNLHLSVDDPPGSSDNDTTYIVNAGDSDGTATFDLSSVPSDFGEMAALTARITVRKA